MMCGRLLRLPKSAKYIWCSCKLSTFSVLLPLAFAISARAGGRQTDAEQVSEHESERAHELESAVCATYRMRDAPPRRQRGEEEECAMDFFRSTDCEGI